MLLTGEGGGAGERAMAGQQVGRKPSASSAMPPQSSTAKIRVPGGNGSGTSGALSSTVPATSVPGVKGSAVGNG